MAPDPLFLLCEKPKTMDHILYACANYSAMSWTLAGRTLTLVFPRYAWDYIMTITITPLEIVYNKLSPAIRLHLQDGNKRKMLMLFLLKVKHDIIFRHAQLKTPRKQELHRSQI